MYPTNTSHLRNFVDYVAGNVKTSLAVQIFSGLNDPEHPINTSTFREGYNRSLELSAVLFRNTKFKGDQFSEYYLSLNKKIGRKKNYNQKLFNYLINPIRENYQSSSGNQTKREYLNLSMMQHIEKVGRGRHKSKRKFTIDDNRSSISDKINQDLKDIQLSLTQSSLGSRQLSNRDSCSISVARTQCNIKTLKSFLTDIRLDLESNGHGVDNMVEFKKCVVRQIRAYSNLNWVGIVLRLDNSSRVENRDGYLDCIKLDSLSSQKDPDRGGSTGKKVENLDELASIPETKQPVLDNDKSDVISSDVYNAVCVEKNRSNLEQVEQLLTRVKRLLGSID